MESTNGFTDGSSSMRRRLSSLYSDFFSSAEISDDLARRMSCPLLLDVPRGWEGALHRLLVVGQETFGWSWRTGEYYPWPHPDLLTLADFLAYEHAIEALIDGYAAFNFAEHQPRSYNSPFWCAFRLLEGNLGADGPCAALWTNLLRCDVESQSALKVCKDDEIRRILAFQRGLLTLEIQSLLPTIVLFLTGPGYDAVLHDEFAGLRMTPAFDKSERQFARLSHARLPEHAYRTYHPGFLRRSRERWGWLEECSHHVGRHAAKS